MTRADLEATLRRNLTNLNIPCQHHNQIIDKFLPAVEEYAADLQPRTPRRALHHTSGTDLYPVIGVLADGLMGWGERP